MLLLLVLGIHLAGVSAEFCPVKACAQNYTSELDRWECFANRIFRPIESVDSGPSVFVEHQCEGFGWGNSMRALAITAQLAAMLDGRLVFRRKFDHLWELPATYSPDHTYQRKHWNYEQHGRELSDFQRWVGYLSEPGYIEKHYEKVILEPNICGEDMKIVSSGDCMNVALPLFGKCMDYHGLNIPIYYMVFRKPAPKLVDHLAELRNRLSLPALPPGLEPNPGQWGLYTPGYYIFGIHVRMVPLGFEPLSLEHNDDSILKQKMDSMTDFWADARKFASQAKGLAACRNETLLIYFASDNAQNLRAVAQEQLGAYGRVVFGLKEDEVGHMSPHWTPSSAAAVDARTQTLQAAAAAAADAASDAEAGGGAAAAAPRRPLNLVRVERGPDAVRRHHDWSLVEWWVLANAQWLLAATPSSYSTTAASWGLGPGARMERMNIGGHSTVRTDWTAAGTECVRVGAADPVQARECPNTLR